MAMSTIVLLAGFAVAKAAENLNGNYVLSQTPGASETQQKFPVHFSDYPGKPDYFDVYSPPIKTLYSQVFWSGLPPVDLPSEVVQRFEGKGMAVVGFEVDQVRRTDQGDVAVPITVAYNHHFETTMIGKRSRFVQEELPGPNFGQRHEGHGAPLAWQPGQRAWRVKELSPSDLPSRADFGGANGGEYRKSFHGYAPSFVQVIESPTQIQITPMQIDTWNRDEMNISHPSRFVPGPVPRTSLAPREGPDALYSGLLECPVTTRLTKHVEGLASIRLSGSCAELPATGAECLELAKGVLPKSFRLRLEKGKEPGCFISSQEVDQAILRFQGPSLHKERRSSFRESRKESPTLGTCGTSAQRFLASSAPLVNVTVQLDSAHDVVTLTLCAGDGAWFGVGFGATAMGDRPWAVIVDGFGNVTERKLENHQPGTLLKPSVTVLESKVMAGVRSVVLTRSLKGASSDYYTFDPLKEETVNFINAVGSGPTLSYHKHRTLGQLVFLPISGEGACVCKEKAPAFGEAQGTLEYRPSGPGDEGSGSVAFSNHCPPAPRSDLLDMRNPTCDLRNYSGGQIACHHMWSLLDADQDIPWPQQPIEYSLKFRFWVEEYNKSYHTSLRRATWGIASPVEYDVPKCDHQVKGCSLVNGSWIHTISGTYEGEGILSAAHFHCHAPTCLSMAMYRCPPKTKVCDASSGELLCEQRPVYGNNSDRFSEPGYIFQPPCLWGSPEFGLAPPPSVGGYVLGTVKTSNASYGHHGEMAWQQMYIFDDPGSESYI